MVGSVRRARYVSARMCIYVTALLCHHADANRRKTCQSRKCFVTLEVVSPFLTYFPLDEGSGKHGHHVDLLPASTSDVTLGAVMPWICRGPVLSNQYCSHMTFISSWHSPSSNLSYQPFPGGQHSFSAMSDFGMCTCSLDDWLSDPEYF